MCAGLYGHPVLHLHGQFCVVSLPYMDNKWSGSERYLLSRYPEQSNALATSTGLVCPVLV